MQDCELLLDLLGAADSACKGAALPDFTGAKRFDRIAFTNLLELNTLSPRLRTDRCLVLPKAHAPQVGMTLRSLSHHLALCPSGEVQVRWWPLAAAMSLTPDDPRANLLVIPYPFVTNPAAFVPSRCRTCGRSVLPPAFGFFKYVVPSAKDWLTRDLPPLLEKAKTLEPSINGVILPESSLPSQEEYELFRTAVLAAFPDAFALAGITEADEAGSGRNSICYDIPLIFNHPKTGQRLRAGIKQSKHHRWRLDASQLGRYGITALDHGQFWWEHVDISQRELNILAARRSFTLSFLICEDLARQEPIAPLLRAVGPDLVIALLQDGPQLEDRWPGRYATALAEDPGTSVLTISSLGMVAMSPSRRKRGTRFCIGLWRDRKGPQQLEVKEKDRALLLRLRSERFVEYSADGRRDEDARSLVLHEHVPVS